MTLYNPRPYQQRMTDFILSRKRAGLLCEMGLGKTVTCLTAMHDMMFDSFQINKVLILAPLRVALLTWPEEIEKWDHTRRLSYRVIYGEGYRTKALRSYADIHIMSYSTLPWLVDYLRQHKVFPHTYDMVVYDESTYVKNKDSQRWTICNALFEDVERKVILTGTPTPNGLHDLWGQIHHLDDGQSLGRSLSDFRRMYFLRSGYQYKPLRNAKKQIIEKISHLAMPMKAEDYLTLPPITYNKVWCTLKNGLEEKYEELEQDFLLEVDGVATSAFDAASLSMKLRQYVQGFLFNDDNRITELHKLKVEALRDIVDSTNDNILVAVQFKHDMTMLRREFGSDLPCVYSESNTNEDIKNLVKWNKRQIKMMAAHPGSLAHGVNLQSGGSTVVFYGMPWSLEHYLQFIARVYRQGQPHPVMCHHLLMKDTIDELIYSVVQVKDRTQSSLMRGIEAYRKKKQLAG